MNYKEFEERIKKLFAERDELMKKYKNKQISRTALDDGIEKINDVMADLENKVKGR